MNNLSEQELSDIADKMGITVHGTVPSAPLAKESRVNPLVIGAIIIVVSVIAVIAFA